MTMQTVSYKRGYLHYNTDNGEAVRAQNGCGESKEFLNERAAKAWLNQYQGHKNWTHWNVSLYINNEYPLYQLALECVRANKNKARAAVSMYRELHRMGMKKTPDGATYSVTAIQAALEGME